jgi:hypothetical protein
MGGAARDEILALLGNAVDELVSDPTQSTDVHILAAESIHKELIPRV